MTRPGGMQFLLRSIASSLVIFSLHVFSFVVPNSGSRTRSLPSDCRGPTTGQRTVTMASTTTDVVVIGSGIGGLCAAAVLADYGYGVTVVEAHSAPGGAAHGFKARAKGVEGTFHFDTGPSFFSGLSNEMQQDETSTNPLSGILRALGEEVPCHVYSTFGLS